MATISAGAFHRRNFVSLASEAITIDATVGGRALTAAVAGASRYARITVESAEVRFTSDGTPASATIGHLASPGDVLHLESAEEIANFRAIRTGGADGRIYVTYQDLKLS